jgi:hypothetical protein
MGPSSCIIARIVWHCLLLNLLENHGLQFLPISPCNGYPSWKCVKLKKPYTPWHWVKHTNSFHVIDSITYGYGFIVVMCPREGGGKDPQRRNCCKDVKQWVPTPFSSLNFQLTTIPSKSLILLSMYVEIIFSCSSHHQASRFLLSHSNNLYSI